MAPPAPTQPVNQPALPAPSDATDPGDQPIIPHEEFRRAKRNSLTWSAIAVLLAPAIIADPHGHVHFFTLATGVPSWLVALALAVAVIYMLIGYWRADELVRARHSELLFDRKVEDSKALADQVLAELKQIEHSVVRQRSQLNNLRETAVVAQKEIQNIADT